MYPALFLKDTLTTRNRRQPRDLKRRDLQLEVLESRQLLTIIPIDPVFSQQWNLHNTGQQGGTPDADIDAPEAWEVTTGTGLTVVAVVDSGIDYTHRDIYLNIWINQGEIPETIRNSLLSLEYAAPFTFRDLQGDDVRDLGIVEDHNANGYIDAGDLLDDADWTNSVDEDGNGKIDDLVGWNFTGSGAEKDPKSVANSAGGHHGLAVAGIIGAMSDNGSSWAPPPIGSGATASSMDPCNRTDVTDGDEGHVAGINWQVSIMPLRISTPYEPEPEESHEAVAQAIDALNYAVAEGAHVSNHSYSANEGALLGTSLLGEWSAAIVEAAAADHILVAAAGNDSSDIDVSPRYPASFSHPNVLTVTATDRQDHLLTPPPDGEEDPDDSADDDSSCKEAAFGDSVDLAAPGGHKSIPTLYAGDKNVDFGRTSAAAPHVTGVVSLIQDLHPGWRYQQVVEQVMWSVDQLPSLNGKVASSGRLNAGNALRPKLQVLFSTDQPGSVLGSDLWHVNYDDSDIIQLSIYEHPVTGEALYRYGLHFDGSDVGLTRFGEDIDAFTVLEDNSFLMSFRGFTTLPELGTVRDEDLVQFVPSSLGEDTDGTWLRYFDGSDVGLSFFPGEDIDAVHALPNGDLAISTVGNATVPSGRGSVTMRDEDLWRFRPSPTSDRTNTSGSFSLMFDGSVLEMSGPSEDIDAVFLEESSGKMFFSTTGALAPASDGLGGDLFIIGHDNDIVEFTPTGTTLLTGVPSAGTFAKLWDGGQFDIFEGVDAMHIEYIADPPAFDPPIAPGSGPGETDPVDRLVPLRMPSPADLRRLSDAKELERRIGNPATIDLLLQRRAMPMPQVDFDERALHAIAVAQGNTAKWAGWGTQGFGTEDDELGDGNDSFRQE